MNSYMDITPLIPKGRQIITGYGGGQFRVNGIVHNASILIFPGRTLPWGIAANQAITLESLQPILAEKDNVELLLIGCHKSQFILPPKIKDAFKQAGIKLEIMDTGAAVRTYNVLLAEERRVAAALIAI